MSPQRKSSQGRDAVQQCADDAIQEVAERFPIGPDTPTYVRPTQPGEPPAEPVNMEREAMLARVEGFRNRLVGVIGTGE